MSEASPSPVSSFAGKIEDIRKGNLLPESVAPAFLPVDAPPIPRIRGDGPWVASPDPVPRISGDDPWVALFDWQAWVLFPASAGLICYIIHPCPSEAAGPVACPGQRIRVPEGAGLDAVADPRDRRWRIRAATSVRTSSGGFPRFEIGQSSGGPKTRRPLEEKPVGPPGGEQDVAPHIRWRHLPVGLLGQDVKGVGGV